MPNIYRDFGNIFRPILFDSSSLYWGITHYAWSFVARLSFVHPSLFLRSSFALWTKKHTQTRYFTYPQHRIWGEMTFARCFGGYKITS